MTLALGFTSPGNASSSPYGLQILQYWEAGFWNLLTFAMQMVLILILGHVVALTPLVDALIQRLTVYCNTSSKAAGLLSFFTILVAYFNWGLGLIFGAILARKIGKKAQEEKIALNYPLLGAAGYAGLMVWHGGLSGSAPLKVAGANHFMIDQVGVIPLQATLFSPLNIFTALLLLVTLPVLLYLIGQFTNHKHIPSLSPDHSSPSKTSSTASSPTLPGLSLLIGALILGTGTYQLVVGHVPSKLNLINFFLFGTGLLLHRDIKAFQKATNTAVQGATGIIIQFPLYAGIMGIMEHSGLIAQFSQFFTEIASPTTFPLYTFFSGAVVNFFVPSGGGQWAVQGPLIADAAHRIGTSFPKCVMALSYGDQLSNMMQPFWALPLLGITGLKARQILPYTLIMMSWGGLIFLTALIIF